MREIKFKVLNKKYSNLMNTLGYTFGMIIFSLSSLFLLLFINRISGSFVAGIFSIGWAVAQQMITIGLFGTRNIQVSDINNNYKFGSFFLFRIFSVILMILSCYIYIYILGLSKEQKIISILLTILMSGESFADVFAGYFQRTNRLAISGISYALRILFYDIICISVLFITHSLVSSIITSVIFSYLWLIMIDLNLILSEENKIFVCDINSLKKLFFVSFSIFLSSFLMNYIVNIPKNAISFFLSNEDQAYYNVLSTPSFVISLFTAVFLVPLYTNIAILLQENRKQFKVTVVKITSLLGIFTIIICLVGESIGIPLMNILFAVNLDDYRVEFALLLFSGGFSSLATFYIYILTILSSSKVLYWVYGVISIIATMLGNYFVKHYHLFGATLTYFIAMLAITLSLLVSIIISLKKDAI